MALFSNPFSSVAAATSTTPSPAFSGPPSLRLSSSSRCLNPCRLSLTLRASLTNSSAQSSGASKPLLEVKNLTAVIAESKLEILKGIDLVVHEGEVHAIMGKNGSGKSTFSKVLVGHPDYEVIGGSMMFKGENLLDMEPEERSLAGLFMTFQSPVEIPGVSNIDFLHMAWNARRRKQGLPELGPIEFYSIIYPKLEAVKMDTSFLNRNVNEGFSGGERKRNEILQLAVLGADLAILDEIDSGLDIDAFQDVARAVNGLLTPNNSILVVTHYRRLLDYIKPMYVHIMVPKNLKKKGKTKKEKRECKKQEGSNETVRDIANDEEIINSGNNNDGSTTIETTMNSTVDDNEPIAIVIMVSDNSTDR